jgi:hypothetical protein
MSSVGTGVIIPKLASNVPSIGSISLPPPSNTPTKRTTCFGKNEADLALLETIKAVKREIRMEHDNSEDAVTWNVFRYMETANLLTGFLSSFTHNDQGNAELIYWSYSQVTGTAWLGLDRARKEFGEHLHRSSEPDLIVVTDKALFFIEAKLKAKNDTSPSNPKERKKYLSGGGGWFQKVFVSEYEPVAIQSRKYELMRFWLLGSWMAAQMGLDFYLVNVVPAAREADIETLFVPHIRLSDSRQFKRLAWEQIYAWVAGYALDCPEKRSLVTYIENKTIGYNRFGELQKAFSEINQSSKETSIWLAE